MIKLASTSLVAAALSLGLTLAAGSAFAGDPPPPPKKEPAACSPGFYKNNLEKWCPEGSIDPCPVEGLAITNCASLIPSLSAELGASAEDRATTAATINACFGTAEESPCDD